MAPEQIRNSAEVDHRADIYSLGVVFYQMLTGELPSGKIEPPSRKVQIDVRLDEIVLRALEREPGRRYQHARDVKTQVETIATSAKSISSATPNIQITTKKSTLLSILAAGAVCILLVAAFFVFRGGKSGPPQIVSITPANGAANVDPDSTVEIRVVFDRPMTDRSWSMTGGGPHFPEGAGPAHYDAKRTTWIAPVKLKPGWQYEFGLNSSNHRNFKSAKEVSLEPVEVTFQTSGQATEPVDLPPKVVSITPANGATDVDPNLAEIQVVFDKPMEDGSWSMCGGGPTFPPSNGKCHYDATHTTWIYPVTLQRGKTYQFGLNSPSHRNFRSAQGVSLEPMGVTFTTAR